MFDANTRHLYRRLLGYIAPYKWMIALTLFTLVVIAAMEPATAAILKDLVDDSLIKKDPDSFVILPILLAGVFIVKGVAEYFSKVASQWIAQKAILSIRDEMFRKLQFLPMATFQQFSTGEWMSKITYDVAQTGRALSEAWIVLIRDTLIVIALFGYMLYISWELTLLMMLIGPVVAYIIDRASKLMRHSSTEMQHNMGRMTHQLEEGLVGHRDIKLYHAEFYEQSRFHQTAQDLMHHTMNVTKVSALNVPLVQVLAAVALSIVVYIAMKMSADGAFTPGELLSYITAMALTFEPIRRLTNINITIQKGMAAAQSIFELLDREEEPDRGQGMLETVQGTLRFDDVTFYYPQADTPTFEHFNLTIPARKTTALVGESGSGKSTLVSLIARFYQPQNGRILLDQHPIDALSLHALREQLAFVSQQVVLFNDTVRANIAYGQNSIDEDAIIHAAQQAQAWDFIQQLPQGLDTPIGDNGARLSGGQRQRLAIARAFLKDAPILILDEATSALDNQSERSIQEAMQSLTQNRTVIVIAHRLSTIEQADQIVVLDRGSIVEQGSHHELMTKEGRYFTLQQQGLANA
ncbi:lipid A export permease/ATP-binding protein MsbA [Thiomicrospira sp. WB1]|uniref:lipid A export permease/ATP-binding protein MsbA n=1 Tax=Thiomicrospira sp. WB1 TaxID=1685380 RepID=UPI00074A254A|nr:lipid A export permease/ATP-binding protein MsbA [Thiomicrospira sp. WB1]KUJ71919.1 lipid A export permease/ATP-binding protein MsbA [Thiomicrospira sp. WB1]